VPSAIYLRPPQAADRAALLAAVAASRTLHRPWITAPETAAEFRASFAQLCISR
jgi:hypothetical protein